MTEKEKLNELYWMYSRGQSAEQIAAELGVSARWVRARLTELLKGGPSLRCAHLCARERRYPHARFVCTDGDHYEEEEDPHETDRTLEEMA